MAHSRMRLRRDRSVVYVNNRPANEVRTQARAHTGTRGSPPGADWRTAGAPAPVSLTAVRRQGDRSRRSAPPRSAAACSVAANSCPPAAAIGRSARAVVGRSAGAGSTVRGAVRGSPAPSSAPRDQATRRARADGGRCMQRRPNQVDLLRMGKPTLSGGRREFRAADRRWAPDTLHYIPHAGLSARVTPLHPVGGRVMTTGSSSQVTLRVLTGVR